MLREVVEELAGELRDELAVGLVEVVAAAEPLARVEHGERLLRRVPDLEVLVDELVEDALLEADARRDDGAHLEHLGESEEDRRGRDDRVGAIGAQVELRRAGRPCSA